MAVTSLKWLGIRPSELCRIPASKRMPLSEREQTILNFLEKDKLPIEIKQELQIFRERNDKAELDALLNGSNELVDIYLPQKFASHDWI